MSCVQISSIYCISKTVSFADLTIRTRWEDAPGSEVIGISPSPRYVVGREGVRKVSCGEHDRSKLYISPSEVLTTILWNLVVVSRRRWTLRESSVGSFGSKERWRRHTTCWLAADKCFGEIFVIGNRQDTGKRREKERRLEQADVERDIYCQRFVRVLWACLTPKWMTRGR